MSRFSRVIVAAVLALGLLTIGLSVVSARLGPTVDTVRTVSSLDGVSVNSTIGISFTEPMDHRSVERSFRLRPSVRGSFNWIGNELVFLPSKGLAYSTT